MNRKRAVYILGVVVLFAIALVIFNDNLIQYKNDLVREGNRLLGPAVVVPEGFAGVPWGASKDQIMETMRQKGYKQLKFTSSDYPDRPVNFDGEFAGSKCILSFHFRANSFYEGTAMLCQTETPQETINSIVDMLSSKYGSPSDPQTGSYEDDKGIQHPYKGAFWRLTDNKSSDLYTILVRLWPSYNKTAKKYYVDVNYQAYGIGKRLMNKEY